MVGLARARPLVGFSDEKSGAPKSQNTLPWTPLQQKAQNKTQERIHSQLKLLKDVLFTNHSGQEGSVRSSLASGALGRAQIGTSGRLWYRHRRHYHIDCKSSSTHGLACFRTPFIGYCPNLFATSAIPFGRLSSSNDQSEDGVQ
jgi:hypothetical protein